MHSCMHHNPLDHNIMMINVKTAIVAVILMMGSVCDGNGEKWTNSWSRRMINCCNTALSCNLLFVYDLFLCIFVTDCPKGALLGIQCRSSGLLLMAPIGHGRQQ